MLMRKTLSILAFCLVLVGIAWIYTQKSTAAATLTPQDYLEIQQLYSRYYHTIDAKEGEAWANTFTADGVFNNAKGHEALAASLRGTLNTIGRPSHTRGRNAWVPSHDSQRAS